MYASVVEIQLKPGKMDEATEIARAMRPDLEQINGLKQFVVIDHCDDKILTVVIYKSLPWLFMRARLIKRQPRRRRKNS